MVKGTLGIIGCPILEDELVYSLSTDPERKNVYVVDTPPARTLRRKLKLRGVPFSLIGERDFDRGRYGLDENGFNVIVIMNKLGLHARPDVLRRALEEQLTDDGGRFDAVALYYGMCGNAGWDVSEWASEHLSIPVFVFRGRDGRVCDDCIGVAVGGCSEYYGLVKRYTGMFYVTPAIAENWDEFSRELNFLKGFEVLDIHTTKEVFRLFGYKNAVRIDTGIGIKGDALDESCERFRNITGLEFVTPEKKITDMYPTERIYKDAKGALER
ncbi:MAG: DUF1638 domain-containing protein [Methanomassiliicoccaceae archaeon]|jgi:hypothetical protein|nr:DUF1638 domain-containing protein [Methanomassiliicoccaceae archaeon]